jgi:hypothetical protein
MIHYGSILRSSSESNFTSFDLIGEKIVIGNSCGSILYYKLKLDGSIALIRQITPPPSDKRLYSSISALKISPCSKYLAIGTVSGAFVVFSLDIVGKRNIEILSSHDEHLGSVITSIIWRTDSTRVFSGSNKGVVVEFICSFLIESSNWFAKLIGKNTNIICRCAKPIHNLSCSTIESNDQLIDLLIVSSGSHAFLYQIDRSKDGIISNNSIMREISNLKSDRLITGALEESWTESFNIIAGCTFISTINTQKNAKLSKFANSILVARSSEVSSNCARLSINYINGEEICLLNICICSIWPSQTKASTMQILPIG